MLDSIRRVIKTLQSAGFDEKQAEAVADAVSQAHIEAELSTQVTIHQYP